MAGALTWPSAVSTVYCPASSIRNILAQAPKSYENEVSTYSSDCFDSLKFRRVLTKHVIFVLTNRIDTENYSKFI